MVLTEWDRLVGHEEGIEERVATRVEELLKLDIFKPLALDDLTGITPDCHQRRVTVGRPGLDLVAVLPVGWLSDERITGEGWLKSDRASITKADVLEVIASSEVVPAKAPDK